MFGFFGIGIMEILILAALGVIPLVAAGVVVAVVLATRKKKPPDED